MKKIRNTFDIEINKNMINISNNGEKSYISVMNTEGSLFHFQFDFVKRLEDGTIDFDKGNSFLIKNEQYYDVRKVKISDVMMIKGDSQYYLYVVDKSEKHLKVRKFKKLNDIVVFIRNNANKLKKV